MKRILVALLATIMFAGPVFSGPKRVVKKIENFAANHVTLGVVTGASSGYATGGTFWCRVHNPTVEGCTEHYGSATGFHIADGIFTGGMIAWSEYGRKQRFREWFLPEVGALAFNLFLGTHEFRIHETAR